ncbi:short-chain fatty acyl-CoA regulator family protein [uncultured Sphingomonas sp.]|uniref:helix-turn-helix domain-containing protein n=1 Tax=uncultured Sphingomonas sp. TaxID=158754 RepID=UPI0035CC1C46
MRSRSARRRFFAGNRVRDLRHRKGLSQTVMAKRLGISISYLSQIETDDRPVTDLVLAALAQTFPLDWVDISEEEEDDNELVRALYAGTDPAVPLDVIDEPAVLRGIQQQPRLARRMIAIHAAYQRSQQQLRVLDDRVDTGLDEGGLLPWEEVRDWFQSAGNYIDVLDRLAEGLASRLDIQSDPLTSLSRSLSARHRVQILHFAPSGEGGRLRSFDSVRRTLFVDRAMPIESQVFELAHQLMRLEGSDEIDSVLHEAALRSDAARRLLQIGLANYAAGALLMPYGRFRLEAKRTRHDIDELRQLFSVSFEQACHRLSTLQRPGAPGIPFFFCRVDMAGNITKRHSATRLQFAQFGGTCPLWNVHEAVAVSDRILVQVAEMPDGVRYISMAKGLVKSTSSYRRPPRRYAVALGCEIEHAPDFIYGDGLGIHERDSATPIGPSCRICSRSTCEQRAFPPAGRAIVVDPDRRKIVPYIFD